MSKDDGGHHFGFIQGKILTNTVPEKMRSNNHCYDVIIIMNMYTFQKDVNSSRVLPFSSSSLMALLVQFSEIHTLGA